MVGEYGPCTMIVVYNVHKSLFFRQRLINWMIATTSAPIYALLEFHLPLLHIIFFQSQWLVSHTTIVTAMSAARQEGILSYNQSWERNWLSRAYRTKYPLFWSPVGCRVSYRDMAKTIKG